MNDTLYIIGRLGKDPKLVTTDNSLKAIVNIATSKKVGEKQETIWFNNVEFINSAAELISKLNKGSQIAFRGVVSRQVRQDSNKRSSRLVISVDDSQLVEILDNKNAVVSKSLPKPPEPYPFNDVKQTQTRKATQTKEAAPIIPESFDFSSRMDF